MIKNITASFPLPISGKVIHVDFSPPPGLTAVVGPNGSGKTFTGSEVTRWLLFGKAALRGAADDYRQLTGKGTFTIADADYTIERTPKKSEITDSVGKVLAVGEKGVNAKVEEIFGYGLTVFDICNASVQKDADSFGKMMPAARKRLIDRVCGVTSVETVEKDCRDKARDHRAAAEATQRMLREPIEPVKPDGYRPVAELEVKLHDVRRLRTAADAITRMMGPAPEPDEPRARRPELAAVEALEAEQKAFIENEAERRRLTAAVHTPYLVDGLLWTLDELDAAAVRNVAHKEIARRGDKPRFPLDVVESEQARWVELEILAREAREEVVCPSCDHKFLTGKDLPSEPEHGIVDLQLDAAAHKRWPNEVEVPDGPDLTDQEISGFRLSHSAKAKADEAEKLLNDLPILLDMAMVLRGEQQAMADWSAYDAGMARARQQRESNAEGERRLRELGPLPALDASEKLFDQLTTATIYEEALARFAEDTERFTKGGQQIALELAQAKAFTEGAAALSEARTELKSALTPLLSSVASALLFEMTNGKLQSIVVDEDMEITVSGQRIETLSGAGVTVANIALRLGLGQVLVKNTFPVFIGDEMDSDADAERREATVDALRNLKDRLKQIILITHKEIENVDRVYNLGE